MSIPFYAIYLYIKEELLKLRRAFRVVRFMYKENYLSLDKDIHIFTYTHIFFFTKQNLLITVTNGDFENIEIINITLEAFNEWTRFYNCRHMHGAPGIRIFFCNDVHKKILMNGDGIVWDPDIALKDGIRKRFNLYSSSQKTGKILPFYNKDK